jgi:hypothetical protein
MSDVNLPFDIRTQIPHYEEVEQACDAINQTVPLDGDLPFDIRTQIPHYAEIEQAYDAINRTVLLIGHIPFRDLYTLPLNKLVEQILLKMPDAVECNLIADRDKVTSTLQQLSGSSNATLTLDAATCDERTRQEASASLSFLRSQGILLPDFTEDTEIKQQKLTALLAPPAADLTYRDLFLKGVSEVGHEVVSAIRKAVEKKVIALAGNRRCCQDGTCVPSYDPNHFCSQGSDGHCSLPTVQCSVSI